MFKTQNGWTKKQMIMNVKLRFKGRALNPRGVGQYEGCLYLTTDKKQCAVGMFIPIDLITESVNNSGDVYGLLAHYPDFKTFMPLNTVGMSKFQSFHDTCKINNNDLTLDHMLDWINKNVTD